MEVAWLVAGMAAWLVAGMAAGLVAGLVAGMAAGMAAGADAVDGMGVLRHGAMGAVFSGPAPRRRDHSTALGFGSLPLTVARKLGHWLALGLMPLTAA